MIKAYKYRLYPNSEQRMFFEKSFGCTRYVYNWALSKRIEAYQERKEKLSYADLCKMLTKLKKEEDKSDLLAALNIKRFGLQARNLTGYLPVAHGVEDVEWSAVAGAVKRQLVQFDTVV